MSMPHPKYYSLYDIPMWDSIQAGAMKLQVSPAGTFRYPPGPICPVSLSLEATWQAICGRGKILSWTVFHRKYLPAYPPPNLVVAVQLEEGPIMISNMDYSELPLLRLDTPVFLYYWDHPDGYKLPRFTCRATR